MEPNCSDREQNQTPLLWKPEPATGLARRLPTNVMDASKEMDFSVNSIKSRKTKRPLIYVNWSIGPGAEIGFALNPWTAQKLINQIAREIANLEVVGDPALCDTQCE